MNKAVAAKKLLDEICKDFKKTRKLKQKLNSNAELLEQQITEYIVEQLQAKYPKISFDWSVDFDVPCACEGVKEPYVEAVFHRVNGCYITSDDIWFKKENGVSSVCGAPLDAVEFREFLNKLSEGLGISWWWHHTLNWDFICGKR